MRHWIQINRSWTFYHFVVKSIDCTSVAQFAHRIGPGAKQSKENLTVKRLEKFNSAMNQLAAIEGDLLHAIAPKFEPVVAKGSIAGSISVAQNIRDIYAGSITNAIREVNHAELSSAASSVNLSPCFGTVQERRKAEAEREAERVARDSLEELCIGAFIRRDQDDIAKAHIEGVKFVAKDFMPSSSAYELEVEDTYGNPHKFLVDQELQGDALRVCQLYLACSGFQLPDGYKNTCAVDPRGFGDLPREVFKIGGQLFSIPALSNSPA